MGPSAGSVHTAVHYYTKHSIIYICYVTVWVGLLCSLAAAQVLHVSQGFTGLVAFIYVLQFESRGSYPSSTGDPVLHHSQVPHGEMNMDSPYLLPLSLPLSPFSTRLFATLSLS